MNICFSDFTRAKYEAVFQNSGLFHIDGEVENKIFTFIVFILKRCTQKQRMFS
jgi:hypothetical protein